MDGWSSPLHVTSSFTHSLPHETSALELSEYLSAFRVTYKEEAALQAYCRYYARDVVDLEDPDLYEAWGKAIPLIRVVFRYEFPTRTGKEQEFSKEDLEQMAAASLFKILRERKVPPFQGRFTNWCFKEIKYRFLDVVREYRKGMAPKDLTVERHAWKQGGVYNAARIVELKDFANSIPQLTKKFVLQRISDRFKDSLHQRAALYVVACLGKKARPNLRILQNYYDIPHPTFWVDLIVVTMREALYRIRSKYGEFLYGSPADYIYDFVEGQVEGTREFEDEASGVPLLAGFSVHRNRTNLGRIFTIKHNGRQKSKTQTSPST